MRGREGGGSVRAHAGGRSLISTARVNLSNAVRNIEMRASFSSSGVRSIARPALSIRERQAVRVRLPVDASLLEHC